MDLLDLVGNTPLVNLGFLSPCPDRIALYGKAEWMNPGGSLKDRPVKQMLCEAMAAGELSKDRIVLDSSSGNAGISYAMIGGALKRKVCIVIPGNASRERKDRLCAHGAELIQTDPLEGYDAALRHVRELYQAEPERYFFCDQYSNANNVLAHYNGTAVELIEQVERPITHFVCGVGTGGSLTGIGRRLRKTYPQVKIIGVMPERWPGIEGLKPLGEPEDIVPDIFDDSLVDEWLPVTADDAREYCHTLAHWGYFLGQSSGAYVATCAKVMAELEQNGSEAVIATLLCDFGERYFSAGLW